MAEKPTIFQKIVEASEAQLDKVLFKAKQDVQIAGDDDEVFYQKAISKDMTYSVGVSGFREKVNKLSYFFLKQMAAKNGVIAAIIQTRQNQVSAFSRPVRANHQRGFKITLKNETKVLADIVEAIKAGRMYELGKQSVSERAQDHKRIIEGDSEPLNEDVKKAFDDAQNVDATPAEGFDESALYGNEPYPPEEINNLKQMKDDAILTQQKEEELFNERELMKLAKKILYKKIRPKIDTIESLIENCGHLDHRPFESKKWTFDSLLRAVVRDSYQYDQIAVEIIPDSLDNLHYFVPVDAGTIRYSTVDLRNYKDFHQLSQQFDILYPEQNQEELLQRDTIKLDDEKLSANKYKYAQVIDGRIERAFTEEELCFGMRNLTTDIWANGYSIAELELLLGAVSSHLYTENFNKQFFVNGFAAKGIVHIADNMPRRKLESFRVMWQHMVKGNRNSFQTPIISGVKDVKWIPLSQGHSDMEFNLWMQYLIRVICAVYQIDPFEIGLGMREMGESGASISGDNSTVKLIQSKSKGFIPLMRFLENFINKNIIERIDHNFKLEFVGIEEESTVEAVDRQQKEVRFKKTVNEIREEDGLPPIPGMDDLILDPNYIQFYNMHSPAGKLAIAEQNSPLPQMSNNALMDEVKKITDSGLPDEESIPEEQEQPEFPSKKGQKKLPPKKQ